MWDVLAGRPALGHSRDPFDGRRPGPETEDAADAEDQGAEEEPQRQDPDPEHRRRLEALATRWVFGERVDHSGVITNLGETLARTFDLESLLPRMVAALEEGLQLSWAQVRLRGVAAVPAPGEPELVVPIELDGEQLGVVECGTKRDGQWTDRDRDVVATFARQAALAVRNVRLTEETARYAADVEVSRSRIARAAESERRRIERNIHDGIQQDLVVLIGMAGSVQDEPDHDVMSTGMVDLRQRLERVLADLRDLASGIYPSVFSDQGILPAVEALVATHPRPVHLRADPELRELRLPEEIEGAAYFTVAEALTNSLKHAGASGVEVTLTRDNGSLTIEVADDGVGFDPSTRTPGRGLEGLADRLGALGGTFTVDSDAGCGTVIHASLARHQRNRLMTAPLRVVIADDHYLVREGVRQALERSARITVIAAVGDASELEAVVDAEHPDVVVTDIRMPPLNRTDGIDAARRIRTSHPQTSILVLSQYNDPSYARQLLEDGVTGVGYLLKERVGDPMRLIAAVEQVAQGGSVIDPEVVASLVARTDRNPESPTADLTDRERDVLAAMAEGRTNTSIADSLHLSVSSIEKYIRSIFSKLGLLDEPDLHRRVAAVLAYLDDRGRARPL